MDVVLTEEGDVVFDEEGYIEGFDYGDGEVVEETYRMPFFQDLFYAAKAAWSLASGYKCLIGPMALDDSDEMGWMQLNPVDDATAGVENPWYVCAAFNNGRAIPLPIIRGDHHWCGPLQRFVIRAAEKLHLRSFEAAWIDCEVYFNHYNYNYR